MSDAAAEKLLKDIEAVNANPPEDAALRKKLYDASKKLMWNVEREYDTIYRVIYSPKILTVAEIASRLKLFQILEDNKCKDLSVAELSKKCGADETLTGRIMRWLASHEFVEQTGEDAFRANHITKTLSSEGFQAGIDFFFNGTMRCLQALPDFLQETKYRNPDDLYNCPSQKAFNTKLSRFDYINDHQPEMAKTFGKWMSAQHNAAQTWVDAFDIQPFIGSDVKPDTVVYVDIGGGVGNQCKVFKDHFSDVPGKVILQDHSAVLKNALPTEGVESMPFDFWEEQPIKNARLYYFRLIFHDYGDPKAIQLLKNTVPAMGKDSYIVIDDMVIPEIGSNPNSTDRDISMMVNFAAIERTERQWDSLFKAAGLKLVKRGAYNENSGESLQVLSVDGE